MHFPEVDCDRPTMHQFEDEDHSLFASLAYEIVFDVVQKVVEMSTDSVTDVFIGFDELGNYMFGSKCFTALNEAYLRKSLVLMMCEAFRVLLADEAVNSWNGKVPDSMG